jgi:calcium permeable stress-gated cation channel
MDLVHGLKKEAHNPWLDQRRSPRDLWIQIAISVALGGSAFLAFCVRCLVIDQGTFAHLVQILRPRWSELYAARKKQKDAAAQLPELPKSMFGWMPVLYRITSKEILASAGLDAYAVGLMLCNEAQLLT